MSGSQDQDEGEDMSGVSGMSGQDIDDEDVKLQFQREQQEELERIRTSMNFLDPEQLKKKMAAYDQNLDLGGNDHLTFLTNGEEQNSEEDDQSHPIQF